VPNDPSTVIIVIAFLALAAVALLRRFTALRFPMDSYVASLWVYFLVFAVAELRSLNLAIWILAGLCFAALREYFSLVDIRLQDRWSLWGAYLAIPFMTYLIQIDWYGMFIISIPVYAFLVTAFLATIGGGEREGTVFSIGAIYFGLFLFVYCIGHLGYLAHYSTWLACLLVINVVVCDVAAYLFGIRRKFTWRKTLAAIPFTVVIAWLLSGPAGLPALHAGILGALIPPLVAASRRTIAFVETDLRIDSEHLQPGKGLIIDNMKSYLYAAPVMFHYVHYFLT
jgi:phosphatidate cytidylyltransferase